MSKISLEPNDSGAGTFTLAAPNSNTNRTLTLPDASGNIIAADASTGRFDSSNMPAGSVIQVVQTIKTDTTSFNNTSFNEIPGFTASITPTSSSNKILVLVHIHFGASDESYPAFRLFRGATWLGQPDAGDGTGCSFGHSVNRNSSQFRLFSTHYAFLDAPNTTSVVNYTVQARPMSTQTEQIFINRAITLGDANQLRATSTITAMEIAA